MQNLRKKITSISFASYIKYSQKKIVYKFECLCLFSAALNFSSPIC